MDEHSPRRTALDNNQDISQRDPNLPPSELHQQEELTQQNMGNNNCSSIGSNEAINTSSSRSNTSLPTSRWQPPSEIQKSADNVDDQQEYQPRESQYPSRRPPPPYDRRPVDPTEFDLPETILNALQVSFPYLQMIDYFFDVLVTQT